MAAVALKAAGMRVPRACLRRRVAADVRAGEGLAAVAGAAGLRGDRLSAWVLQARPPGPISNPQNEGKGLAAAAGAPSLTEP